MLTHAGGGSAPGAAGRAGRGGLDGGGGVPGGRRLVGAGVPPGAPAPVPVQNCDFSGAVLIRGEWSGCDFSNCASAGRSGRTRWCGIARGTAAGSPPAGGGAVPWARAPSAAPILHSRGGKSAHGELPASPGRAGRGGCGRPEPTPDGVPGGGLFPHAAEGGGFFPTARWRASPYRRAWESCGA